MSIKNGIVIFLSVIVSLGGRCAWATDGANGARRVPPHLKLIAPVFLQRPSTAPGKALPSTVIPVGRPASQVFIDQEESPNGGNHGRQVAINKSRPNGHNRPLPALIAAGGGQAAAAAILDGTALASRLQVEGLSWRSAKNEDAAALYDFIAAERGRFGIERDTIPQPHEKGSMDAHLLRLEQAFNGTNGQFIIIERDGQIVAVGAWRRIRNRTAELLKFYKAEAEKCKGVGKGLAELFIQHLRERGYRRIELYTNALFKNEEFWKNCGFSRYSRRGKSYKGADIHMEMNL